MKQGRIEWRGREEWGRIRRRVRRRNRRNRRQGREQKFVGPKTRAGAKRRDRISDSLLLQEDFRREFDYRGEGGHSAGRKIMVMSDICNSLRKLNLVK